MMTGLIVSASICGYIIMGIITGAVVAEVDNTNDYQLHMTAGALWPISLVALLGILFGHLARKATRKLVQWL